MLCARLHDIHFYFITIKHYYSLLKIRCILSCTLITEENIIIPWRIVNEWIFELDFFNLVDKRCAPVRLLKFSFLVRESNKSLQNFTHCLDYWVNKNIAKCLCSAGIVFLLRACKVRDKCDEHYGILLYSSNVYMACKYRNYVNFQSITIWTYKFTCKNNVFFIICNDRARR